MKGREVEVRSRSHGVKAVSLPVTTATRTAGKFYRTVDCLVGQLDLLPTIGKKDLVSGDQLTITTENSVYSFLVLENFRYIVHGGWFDRNVADPVPIAVNGCTFGGSVIMTDIVAGIGLRIEFANGVVTSPVCDAGIRRCNSACTPDFGLEATDRHLLKSLGISWRTKQS
jgi:hypothetical protein